MSESHRHRGGEEDHVSGGHDHCRTCAETCRTTSILRVLRATENTTIASYRGTCVEMYAYCSLVMVSYFPISLPTLLLTNYIAEGVGKSTIVTSLIKESFVSQVGSHTRAHAAAVSLTHPGSTYRPGSYHPSRSYPGKCDNVHCGFRMYVSIPHSRTACLISS